MGKQNVVFILKSPSPINVNTTRFFFEILNLSIDQFWGECDRLLRWAGQFSCWVDLWKYCSPYTKVREFEKFLLDLLPGIASNSDLLNGPEEFPVLLNEITPILRKFRNILHFLIKILIRINVEFVSWSKTASPT